MGKESASSFPVVPPDGWKHGVLATQARCLLAGMGNFRSDFLPGLMQEAILCCGLVGLQLLHAYFEHRQAGRSEKGDEPLDHHPPDLIFIETNLVVPFLREGSPIVSRRGREQRQS